MADGVRVSRAVGSKRVAWASVPGLMMLPAMGPKMMMPLGAVAARVMAVAPARLPKRLAGAGRSSEKPSAAS